jgi:hypothetical protein
MQYRSQNPLPYVPRAKPVKRERRFTLPLGSWLKP